MSEVKTAKLKTKELLYSSHVFLYPFEWTYKGKRFELLEDQTNLEHVVKLMEFGKGDWESRGDWTQAQTLAHFNEVVYFYDFVWPVLYDTEQVDSLQKHYYYKKLPTPFEYVIEIEGGETYRLDVDDIVLSFFNAGVGLMAFHLLNREPSQSSPQDILNINYFGRRLSPPFLSTQTDLINQQAFFDDANWKRGLSDTQKFGELAKSIRLESNGTIIQNEDFSSWLINQNPSREPELIKNLLPIPLVEDVKLSPVLDDRMFVVCWYGNTEMAQNTKQPNFEDSYKTDEWWYRYVFVDRNSANCPNLSMRKKLLEEATYPRWISQDMSTYYGVSRYSFVALTEQMSVNPFAKIICSHVRTLYYKIAMLCLVQRACLLRFSQEITAISKMKKDDPKVAARVGSLFRQYLRFVNKIYFREITAQEQGIELYEMLQNQMRLEKQVKDLEAEISELHNYVSMLEEGARNDKLELLTYMGALFVVPSFLGTYFGINGFDMKSHALEVSLMCLVTALLAFMVVKSRQSLRIYWLIALIGLMIYFLFIYPQSKLFQ